ncbi:MAG: DUF192 domain-containing protein [Pseudobdellovibrionaceae bacterium]
MGTVAHSSDIVFEKGKIKLAGKTISVELAKTQAQHERGLMFRKNLPENEGMLFVFNNEETRYFWMKDTFVDLSIGYFNKEKVLVDIQEMKATSVLESRPPSYPSALPAMYALEMKKGWFTKNKLKIGQKFQFSSR